MNLKDTATAAAVVFAGVVGYLAWKKASQAAAVVADKLNPASDNNIVYRDAVGSIGGAIYTAPDDPGKTADGGWNLGAWLRDITSDDDERIRAMLKGSAPPGYVPGGVIDPAGGW